MRASDFDLLIVPRLGGPAEGEWPSRWQAKLSTARFVHPADPADRRREAWTEAIAGAAREAKRPALLVGHGTGAAAIAEAAKALGSADVRGAFLVAPPDEQSLGRLAGDGLEPRPRAPALAERRGREPQRSARAPMMRSSRSLADWGAELIDAGEAGGLDAASGHGPWPEGLMRLAAFIKGIGERAGAGL